jgi:hypothetical protein
MLVGADLDEWVRQHGYVELRWAPESDDINGVAVAAMSPRGFAGCSSGWINEQPVRTFAERLRDYPLNEDDLPTLVTGSQPPDRPYLAQISLRDIQSGRAANSVFRCGSRPSRGHRRRCEPNNMNPCPWKC